MTNGGNRFLCAAPRAHSAGIITLGAALAVIVALAAQAETAKTPASDKSADAKTAFTLTGAEDPKKSQLPAGTVQGRTDFGTTGYGGPCPLPGKPHHYYFWLYALKVPKLDIPADATAALVGFNVKASSIGKAELMGLYGR
jgi:phosphatidylethanolamine-binding protein (PEBP) family uncharacterized protein